MTFVPTLKPSFTAASKQGLRPGKYSAIVRLLSLGAFLYIIFGFLNHSIFHWVDTKTFWGKLLLSHRTEYMMILLFGIWRSVSERDSHTRKRLIFLTVSVTSVWFILPEIAPILEPHFGTLPGTAVFPSLHLPGTLSFFLTLVLVFLFGRRIICGWFCPCVAVRETVGFSFRSHTVKSEKAYAFRYVKYVYFVIYAAVTILILISSPLTERVYSFFMMVVILPYFGTFLLSPCSEIVPTAVSSAPMPPLSGF